MSNQQKLKEYLVGENGYLKNDISNGKVIMLSGKWGSGKTHFWKEILAKELKKQQSKNQKTYVYSSLYGNNSIDKIEDNIYAQSYLCSIGGKNIVTTGYEKVRDFGKRFGSFCSLLDVSKLVDGIDEIQQKNIKKSALSYIENGGLICFDDFERKSKDIDLNDLFGLISHFAIDLNCKVVIILNDDVFEGKEKDIFSNVKEKTVSKFLKYEPSIEELFELIFNNEINFVRLEEYKETILESFQETKILNARIYNQILINLSEWKIHNNINTIEEVKYLIFVNINFILYHTIPSIIELRQYDVPIDYDLIPVLSHVDSIIVTRKTSSNADEYINRVIEAISANTSITSSSYYEKIIYKNVSIFKSIYFMMKFIKPIKELVNLEKRKKINNFIETGIL